MNQSGKKNSSFSLKIARRCAILFLIEYKTSLFVGYLSTPPEGTGKSIKNGNGTLNTLTDAQKSRLNSLENTINDHLTEGDFSGTLRDLQGNPVPNGKGGFFDHMGEMKDSYNSLSKIRRGLEGSLKNPNLSEIDRALLQEGLDKANSNITRIDELFAPYGGIN